MSDHKTNNKYLDSVARLSRAMDLYLEVKDLNKRIDSEKNWKAREALINLKSILQEWRKQL